MMVGSGCSVMVGSGCCVMMGVSAVDGGEWV